MNKVSLKLSFLITFLVISAISLAQTAAGVPSRDSRPQLRKAPARCTVYTVAKDGTAQFTSVQAAVDAVRSGERGIIIVSDGVYEENVTVGSKANRDKVVSIIGESRDGTILTSSVSRGKLGPGKRYTDCAALNIFAHDFYAENITIRNTAGNVGQAEALYTAGDRHIFRNCRMLGFQDTYKADIGCRGYFINCLIEGATDFIYDSGLEWFEQCRINCVKGGHYITAAADSWLKLTRATHPLLQSADTINVGLVFNRCDITANADVPTGDYVLGRPWKKHSGTAFLNCRLGSHIRPEGWNKWGGSELTASYYEYRNTDFSGNLVDTSHRISFGKQLTQQEYDAYFNPSYLFSQVGNTPFTPQQTLAAVSKADGFVQMGRQIRWNADASVAAWLVYRGADLVAAVTEPTYITPDADATPYIIRCVSRHGVVGEPVVAAPVQALVAFPGAEGFGKYATGGRGGEVVRVTSLADDGTEGTLRWAFSQHLGKPITIVFAVSGQIRLNSSLRVKRADWTLAGQTAPGDGILISHHKVNFGGSQNFIVRNVRFRIGKNNTRGALVKENAVGAENCYNFIFDHCTFGWSVEENFNTFDSHFLTIQNCIVHEGFYNAGHFKGVRGYGCQWGGSPATYHHNLLAHNKSRSCRINGARGEDGVTFIEYINNVNYNYGGANACYGGENTAKIEAFNGRNSAHECNFIANYYKPGPMTPEASNFLSSNYARKGATSWGPSKWYVSGNKMHGNKKVTRDNWLAVNAETYTLDQIKAEQKITPSLPYYRYTDDGCRGNYDYQAYALTTYDTADKAYRHVLDNVGTINRDRVEQRIISDVRKGTATYGGASYGRGALDSESDAEGFYPYSTDYTVPADTDADGMPDAWETAHGYNPSQPDNNTVTPSGYTALETYLNSFFK